MVVCNYEGWWFVAVTLPVTKTALPTCAPNLRPLVASSATINGCWPGRTLATIAIMADAATVESHRSATG